MSRIVKDLLGQTFGRLEVIEYVGIQDKHAYWKVECICGNTKIVSNNNLMRGATKSCGCLNDDARRNTALTRKPKGQGIHYQPTGNPVGRPKIEQGIRDEVARLAAHVAPALRRHYDPTISPYASC